MDRFRKIIDEKNQKSKNRKPKYGTRKLSIGLVSCLLGFLIFGYQEVSYAEEETIVNPLESPGDADTIASEAEAKEITSEDEVEEEVNPVENTEIVSEEENSIETNDISTLAVDETGETETVKEDDNVKYEAYAQQGVNFAQLGKVPEAKDFIANKDQLPQDIEVRWEDETVFDALSKEAKAYAIVKYKDGTEDRVMVLFEISGKYEVDGVVYTGTSYSNEMNLKKEENNRPIYQGTTLSNAVTEEERSKSEVTVTIEDIHAANESTDNGAKDENGFTIEKKDEIIQYLELSDELGRYVSSIDGKN